MLLFCGIIIAIFAAEIVIVLLALEWIGTIDVTVGKAAEVIMVPFLIDNDYDFA